LAATRRGGSRTPAGRLPELDELRVLRGHLAGGADPRPALDRVRTLLDHSSSLVCARAAHLLASHGGPEDLFLLEESAARWLDLPAKRDPGCLAKTALFKALVEGESTAAQLFRGALGVIQKEPVWGGSVDTAAGLRALAAEGLLACDDAGRMDCWARLLADPEPEARRGALRALGASADPCALPLLRYKCLSGDPDPDLLRAGLAALLALAGPEEIGFVSAGLRGDDGLRRQAAALALCEAGSEAALDPVFQLLAHEPEGEFRELLRLALAGSGLPAARAWLLAELAQGPLHSARGALQALLALRDDPELAREVADTLARRGSRELELAWRIHRLDHPEEP
jgi:hypothetical protein